ncbi:MAG: SgcJ/EcaC family oxidoreductase [Flavobacterium sp.]
MKKIALPIFLLLIMASWKNQAQNKSVTNNLKQVEMNTTTDKTAIEKLLFSYRDALNSSNVSTVMSLYTQDGVFMPANAPTAKGQQQLKNSYEFVFKAIQLNIEFFIEEIVISGKNAYAITNSKGTTLIHANGQTVPEENREVFVLVKENEKWKIARYMFNKSK